MWFWALLLHSVLAGQSTWDCVVLSNQTLHTDPVVWWVRQNCTGHGDFGKVGPIVVNMVDGVMTKDGPLRALPVVGNGTTQLNKLSILSTLAHDPLFVPLAGINGGYFWRLDDSKFIDDVCFGKFREEAVKTPSASDPNAGVGDSLTIIAGQYASSNCDKAGNSMPVAMVLDYPPSIAQLTRGARLPSTVQNAIGAGPNLVSYNVTSSTSFVDIKGDNVNILEHASNTAVALRTDAANVTHLVLTTFDGIDGCVEYNPKCGINAHQFASYLLDHVGVRTAMEMDQGGSTTMWIRGQPNDGIVSNPGLGQRNVFNGLFVGL